MRTVKNQAEIEAIERERALVGVYVDRFYSPERFEWLLRIKRGFDHHARSAWHLLVPIQQGYGVDARIQADDYGVELAAGIIDKLGIPFADLPCIVFRAKGEEFFFLKLGRKTQDQFLEEIGLIADLARECASEGQADAADFRDYVNMQVANHLRRRRILSATRSALPALGTLLGGAVDFKELV